MRNNDLRLVVDLFKFYVIQITKNESYRFKINSVNEKQILNFIEVVNKFTNSTSLGKDYLKDYMEYQFNFWYKIERTLDKNKELQISWVIGNKAFKRWTDRTEKQKKATSYFIRKGLKTDIKIAKVFDEHHSEYVKLLNDINFSEENEKERFLNTTKGFINCQISTTLFNHKSKNCSVCRSSLDCKELLKNNMVKVYKARKYHKL